VYVANQTLVNWVNQQITPPLDLRELTATGRDGPIIDAAAAYSLRNLSDSYTGNVVEVRRNTDGALRDFKASEVTDGTLEAWVNTSFANALPLDTASGAAAAYSLRNLSSSYSGNVVEVRRSSDDTTRIFTAAEVADGTLVSFVNENQAHYASDYSSGLDNWMLVTSGWTGSASWSHNASNDNRLAVTATATAAGAKRPAISLTSPSNILTGQQYSLELDYEVISGTPVLLGNNFNGGYYGHNETLSGSGTATIPARTFDASLRTAFVYFDGENHTFEISIKAIRFKSTVANGFVDTWYDQSGNGNHAIQGTDASQPKIVDAGSLVSGGIDFDGTDDFFDITPISTSSTALSTFIFGDAQPSVFSYPIGNNNNAGIGVSSTQFRYNLISGTPIPEDWPSTLSGQNLYTFIHDGTTGIPNISGYRNGAIGSQTSASQGAAPSDFIRYIGTRNQVQEFDGVIGELIIYTSDQSDKRIAIEENIGSNYGITVTSSKEGTVSTWYDQSTTAGTPNANHAVQATPASQPKIVSAGSLLNEIKFDGADDVLNFTEIDFSTNSWMLSAVVDWDGSISPIVGGGTTQWALQVATSDNFSSRATSDSTIHNFDPTSSIATGDGLFTVQRSSDVLSGYYDGVFDDVAPAITAASEFKADRIGQRGSFYGSSGVKEIIIYNTDQSSNRAAIEANIGEVYSIAGIPAYDDTVNGFVESWYDQSGNDNDAVQFTASSQPKIVDAGVLVTDRDGKVALNGKGAKLALPTNAPMLSTDGTYSLFAVVDFDDQRNGNDIFNNILKFESTTAGGAASTRKPLASLAQTTGSLFASSPSFSSGSVNYTLTETLSVQLFTNIANPALSTGNNTLYADGALVGSANNATSVNTDNLLSSNSHIFDNQETTVTHFLSEVIYYPSDQSANRAGIEANIILQYDI
jgi:hypothetical protein